MASRRRGSSVVVVGGGPAGLTAASELARRGLGVTLVQAEGHASARVGEHIGPAAVQRLANAGPGRRGRIRLITSSAAESTRGGAARRPSTTTICTIRSALASTFRVLASIARSLGFAASGAYASWRLPGSFAPIVVGARWDIEVAFGGGLLRAQPEYVVDASGRSAAFARMQGIRSSAAEKQIAIIGGASGIAASRTPSARVVIEATRTGWWYFAALRRRALRLHARDRPGSLRSLGPGPGRLVASRSSATPPTWANATQPMRGAIRFSFDPLSRGGSTPSTAPAGWRSAMRR